MTNGAAKALHTSEKVPLPNKQPCGLPIGLIVSLDNAELGGVKLKEEQVVGNSFKLGPTLETSVSESFTVANLPYRPCG